MRSITSVREPGFINDRIGFRGDLRYQFGGDFVPDYWRLAARVAFGLGTH
jgi:hypothetical protein